ncbi:MAG: KamA family radical SAM protein [Syntrophobacterales bacterium]|nr:MAG: KamA family radical SAM protein [Syntrophobacterales bacterium]
MQEICFEDGEPPDGRPASVALGTVHIDAGKGEKRALGLTRVPKLATVSGFLASSRALQFQRKFFKDVSAGEWNDWHWQLRHRITTLGELEKMFQLSDEERSALSGHGSAFPVAITPYYASLIDPDNPSQPLRRTVIPTAAERIRGRGENEDPLGEEKDTAVPGLVHRYPDRVLFLLTDTCSTYCRYCTRSRIVGGPKDRSLSTERWNKAIEYIESNQSIRDVLLSGGDPLTLPDDTLEWLLSRLRRIPHVEVVRLGTKAPVVMPQRITPALCRMLGKFHPLWVSIHFTHPAELTEEVKKACEMLANAGIPLQSQTVLLSGINDDVDTMRQLFHGLVKMRVRPYYLYQCDPIIGSGHFRTPVEKGLEIIRGLRGYTSGFAIPTYAIDCPGGGGKVPLMPDYAMGRDGDDVVLKNYAGNLYRYFDGEAAQIH